MQLAEQVKAAAGRAGDCAELRRSTQVIHAGKEETNGIRSTQPNHANTPRATKMGAAAHPAPWVMEGQKLYPRKGPPDPRKGPPPTLLRSLGLNSIALLIHCSATGHRLQGGKKPRQLSRFMHISNRSCKAIYKQSQRNSLSAHSLENIRAGELNPTISACVLLIQLSSNFTTLRHPLQTRHLFT